MFRFVLTLVSVSATVGTQMLEPPSFTQSPQATTLYIANNEGAFVDLVCRATGSSPLDVAWRKDDQPIQGTSNVYKVSRDTRGSEGYYQCRINNPYGTVVSNETRVLKARQASFPTGTQDTYHQKIGDKLKVICPASDVGSPQPTTGEFSWKDEGGSAYSTNSRVQIDSSGNLHFAYLQAEDFPFDRACYIQNRINNAFIGGDKAHIVEISGDKVPESKPMIYFYTNQSENAGSDHTVVTVIEKQSNVSLRCFFSGGPDIKISWTLKGGSDPPANRMLKLNSNSELLIKEVQEGDAGDFVCEGRSRQGSTRFTTKLVVYAAPEFKSKTDGPYDIKANVGDNVEFHCKPYAKPEAKVEWFRNGEPLDPENPPSSKFRWSEDRKTLTILNVCKDNCTGKNDIMVIQCNASNTFGYAYKNGYINVFERTVWIQQPEDVTFDDHRKTVSFYAHAYTDPSTPLTYTWYFGSNKLVNDSKYYITDEGRNLTINDVKQSDGGDYICEAWNGISKATATAKLQSPLVEASVWWWIPLLLLLIFLIILCIICCCIYAYRQNRGEEYHVDETERKMGNDPEKDLLDADLKPFSRLDEQSTHSVNNSEAGSTRSLLNDDGYGTKLRRPSADNVVGN